VRFNRELVRRQIAESREELQELEKRLAKGPRLELGEFEVLLAHAYHHLNFAWNCRAVSDGAYRNMSHSQFRKWGKVPVRLAESLVRWAK
jgi:hypothetical protein